MQVIPVIDLLGGVVVRARMGERDSYRPIQTPLSPTSDPIDVVSGLMRLASFPILYVADLDAIRKIGENWGVLKRLRREFPQVLFWIDNGAAHISEVEATKSFGQCVLGSESQRGLSLLSQARECLLSLDFRDDKFVGPPEIWSRPDAWPERVIVMSLGRVGAGIGPDLERLRAVRKIAAGRQIYAAGGLRDIRDLELLRDVGAVGVLAASALHDGRLGPEAVK